MGICSATTCYTATKMFRRIRPKLVGVWLICGIIIPAVFSQHIQKQTAKDHGVLVTNSAGSWYESSIQGGLNRLTKHELLAQEISCYFWSPEKKNYFVVAKGRRNLDIKVNSIQVFHKEKKLTDARMIEIPAGWSFFQIQIKPDNRDLKDPVTIVWSDQFGSAREIPARQSYSQKLFEEKILQERVARILGIAARMNVVFLVFWIIFHFGKFPLFQGEGSRLEFRIAILALLVIVALRFYGITYLVEEGLHPDEKLYGGMIQEVRKGELIPSKFYYTSGYFFITAAAEKLAEWVSGFSLPQNLIQRSVSAICSSLTCVLIFSVARTLFSFEAAIFAMLFLGLAFMPVELAHYGIVEPTMVFFFFLSFASLVGLSEKPSLKGFAKAGLFAGAAVAVKQTAALIGLPFLITWFFLLRQKMISRTGIKEMMSWFGCAFLSFLVLSPGTIIQLDKFYQYQMLQTKSLEGESQTHNFFVESRHFGGLAWDGLHSGMGYALIIAAVIGAFLIWKRSRIAAWICMPTVAAYLILIGTVKAVPEHYVLILCPFVALLAAVAVDSIPPFSNRSGPGVAPAELRRRDVRATLIRKWMIAGVVVVLVAINVKEVFVLERLLHGKDTRQQAVEWCYTNLPPGSKIDYDIFGPRFLIPMFDTSRQRLFDRPPIEHYLAENEPDYFIQDSITTNVFLDAPKSYFSNERQWYESLSRVGSLTKEFREEEFRLLNPDIRIYKLRSGK
jgi:hypothetical protein